MARQRFPHLFFVRVRHVAQMLRQRHQHARRAEAALQAVVVAHRFLQRVELSVRQRQRFDGGQFLAVGLHGQHLARARGAAVEVDGAGAAHAVLAPDMRSGQTQLVADEVGQQHAGLDLALVVPAVDIELDLATIRHAIISLLYASASCGTHAFGMAAPRQPRARMMLRSAVVQSMQSCAGAAS